MMTRPFIIAALGSLLVAAPATAERRTKRTDDSRRSLGKVDRTRDDQKSDADTNDDDDDRPKKRTRRDRDDRPAKPSDVAQASELEDSDGPEARAVLPIKLDDLIDVAVRNAPDLSRARADRNIAKGQAGAARKNQSWVLGAEANYSITATGREVIVAPLQDVRVDTARGILSLRRNLPTGGSLGIELGMTRTASEIAISQNLIDQANSGMLDQLLPEEKFSKTQAIGKLTLTQPLARGFGPDVALAQEKRADLEFTEATLKTQLAAEDMLFNVVSDYWTLSYLAYEVDVRNAAVELAEGQEKVTRDEIRVGSQAPASANAVVFQLATRREALLNAQLEFEKKSLEVRRKIGLELSRRQIALRPADQLDVGNEEWNLEEVLERSRKANRRLLQAGMQRRIAEVDVKVAKNALLPAVDLTLSGGVLGTGNSTDEAFSGVGEFNGYEVLAGLKVEFEIGGAAKAAHQASLARQARTEIDRADRARTLDAEVVTAVKSVTSSRARVGFADKAIFVAEDNVKVERQSFLAGRSDNFRVMERQTELIEARLRRGKAVVDYHVAVAQLQHLSGVLLEQYKVDVRPARSR